MAKNFYEYEITSPYGERTDPITNEKSFHGGIDYALPLNTEVISNVKGKVYDVNTNPDKSTFGIYVEIIDENNVFHKYAHLNSTDLKKGQEVSIGDILGLSGSTGRSTGPHLHYQVSTNNWSDIHFSLDDYFLTPVVDPSNYVKTDKTESNVKSWDDFSVTDWTGKAQLILFYIFKFIIMIMLIILFVVFITKSMDINVSDLL